MSINPFKYSIFQLVHMLRKSREMNNAEFYTEKQRNANNVNIVKDKNGNDMISQDELMKLMGEDKKNNKIMSLNPTVFAILLGINLLFFFLTIVWLTKCFPVMSPFTKISIWALVILGLFVPGLSFIAFLWVLVYRFRNKKCTELKVCRKRDDDNWEYKSGESNWRRVDSFKAPVNNFKYY